MLLASPNGLARLEFLVDELRLTYTVLHRYVAMHAMQDDGQAPGHEHHSSMNGYGDLSTSSQRKQNKVQMRDTLATVAGMLLPLLTQFGHHH